jgi:hypothetical protein
MSRRTLLVLLALLTPVALLSQMTSKNMAAGTWKLDVAKSEFNLSLAPKSATVVIGDDGKIQYSEELADGKSRSWSVTPTSDGTPAPITGIENATLIEKRMDDRHVQHIWRFGDVAQMGKSVISKDGTTMTYTLSGTNADGKQKQNIEIFEKQ